MAFEKKMKQRRIIALSYIALGLALAIADVLMDSENYFFCSFGVALLVMGILRLRRYRKITASDQTMRKQELAENDERTRMISERAKKYFAGHRQREASCSQGIHLGGKGRSMR